MATIGLISSGHIGGTVARLARPAADPERSVLAIAGDDAGAKRAVTGFLDDIGYDTVDAGPLAEGWRFQRDTAAYGAPYVVPGERFPGSGRAATATEMEHALAAARRYADM
jgi:8-hydroxy-5-deazaflavin:NADPH oxidoreductase